MRVESQDCVKVRLHELGGEEGDDGFPGRDEVHAVSEAHAVSHLRNWCTALRSWDTWRLGY